MMIQKLTLKDVLGILKKAPEQCVFDWKHDLSLETEEKKGETIKDIIAVANGTTTSPGFVFYGVNPQRSDPVAGMSSSYDDASFQQIVSGKVEPMVDFLYYEVSHGTRKVGIFHIPASKKRPHIIVRNYGKLREGQLLIRQGSSTRGMKIGDLFETFYGETSPYFQDVLDKVGLGALHKQAAVAEQREYRAQLNALLRQAEVTMGLPPGSLGSR
ncbi:MAG: ATP-binding protein [Candidatus Hodarchaeota archaeon]